MVVLFSFFLNLCYFHAQISFLCRRYVFKGGQGYKIVLRGKDMQTKSLLKKGFTVGIIVLLGLNIIPQVNSRFIEKYVSITNFTWSNNREIITGLRGLNITFNGTMGENGWYISPVEIIIVFENDTLTSHFYYKIDNGDWIEYTPPVDNVFVNEDGGHSFEGYFTDYEGNIEGYIGPFSFKIDQTPPEIYMTTIAQNLLRTKWLLNATVSDATSGVAKVDFYVDDVLVGNATAYPYTYTYKGKGTVAQAVAYDNAGNWYVTPSVSFLISQQSNPLVNPSPNQQQISQQGNQLLQNLILHHKMIAKLFQD